MPDPSKLADLRPYAGRWVALLSQRVIGVGLSRHDAYMSAKRTRPREEPSDILRVPDVDVENEVDRVYWERFFEGTGRAGLVRALLLAETSEAYLVGGCVRDAFLGRESHDLDLVVPHSALEIGRRVADALQGSFYPLDLQRGFARIVSTEDDGRRVVLDLSPLAGGSLCEDLAARDFTMNAMALRLSDFTLMDPFEGQSDLERRRLRLVSERGIAQDPIRALRAVRLAAEFGLAMDTETRHLVAEDGKGLVAISRERIRDELMKILELPAAAQPLADLLRLDLLQWILPEMAATVGLAQSAPHRLSVWDHSLLTVSRLETFLSYILAEADNPPGEAQADEGPLRFLGEFRPTLHRHLTIPLSDQRPRWVILKLAALLHDVGKPDSRHTEPMGRVRFVGHAGTGAETAEAAARRLRLSLAECNLLRTIVAGHMWPISLAGGSVVTVRAAHRYYRDLGNAGLDVALLALADSWAFEPGPVISLPRAMIARAVAYLLRHWLTTEGPESRPPLLSGTDVMHVCGIPSGRDVGHWLRQAREAQVMGRFHDRAGAIRWLQQAWESKARKRKEEQTT